jgi:CHAD domain-containing protein
VEAERFIAGIKHIQDVLGDWHDWLTLTKTASENLGEVRESALVAELHNVTGAKFRHAVSALSQMRDGAKPAGALKPAAAAKSQLSTSAA